MASRRGKPQGEKVPYNKFKHNRGELIVGTGRHEVQVTTEERPREVWLSMSSEETIPVCLGEVDMCSCSIVDTGFILHALIYSTGAVIEWLADLE